MAERHAFICGYPVRHSRSPLIHGHWLARHGLEGSYRAIEVTPEEFPQFIRTLPQQGFAGGNITLPHKEAALAAVDEADEAARRIGAVNTVWLEGERLLGTNTDWIGFALSMDEAAPGWDRTDTAVVLGAGGAARGIVHALSVRGIGTIHIVNRSAERAGALARQYVGVHAAGWADLAGLLPRAGLLVNTTSLGMAGKEELQIDLSPGSAEMVVCDIVYVPLETALLRQAKLRGLRAVDGLGMLLHQAVPGFEKWFGVRPEVTPELRRLVLKDLGQCA